MSKRGERQCKWEHGAFCAEEAQFNQTEGGKRLELSLQGEEELRKEQET